MPKPIAVIYFPMDMPPENFQQATEGTVKELGDSYHCLCTIHAKNELKVEVHSAEKATPEDVEALQTKLMDKINEVQGWK